MRPSLFALLFAPAVLAAQQPYAPPALTADDYARAEKFMAYNAGPLVFNGAVRGTWAVGDRILYRNQTPAGSEFIVADPVRKTRAQAFDQTALAAALSAAAETTYDAMHLPFTDFAYTPDGKSITFDAGSRHWTCALAPAHCAGERRERDRGDRNAVPSPDGKRVAFIKADNLWVRDVQSGQETQLTSDGVPDFGYATDNAGWVKSDRPILVWSPDSKKIATFQQDQRGVGEMYLVQTRVGHPILERWKYPLPGDTVVAMIQRVIIDVDHGTVIRLQMPPDQHRSTLCDHILCDGAWTDVDWSPDASKLFFVSTSRDHKQEWVRVADAATGAVRDVFSETSPTQYESGFSGSNIRPLWNTNELIWFSERDNWGHLYLYDLATGKLKNRITRGDWPVLEILRVDEASRTVWFVAAGREPANPYFRQLWSVRLDGSRLTNLTPETGDHDVVLSPDGKFFLDNYSQPDVPWVSVLRDAAGRVVVPLETMDISRLVATGWKPPLVITVKARDGKTDLYGLLFRPTALDTTKKYPIVNNIYPGPQIGSVGFWGFAPARGDAQAMAELGFVVVQIDAMGTPMRSKAFHDAYYGDMGDNGLPDQIAGEKELARRYAWIDLDRAGIWGHSGGGFASTDGILRYPDFFKVAVSEAGNHDNRDYEDDWGERYQGLLNPTGGPQASYEDQANEHLARNLKGKLLIAFGTTDNNVPPYNSLLLVDSLIAANKDFDLLALPNRRHGFGGEPYMVRRRWDYFVKNLLGATPPAEYQMHTPAAPANRRP
ncbi:MAG TPA: DPP IV N-terminal domain-containing protein [Gemmatimonadales bacterium]|nr:DPP IV N-terminal domain-containing protein [Gemmatimonadales bacterium]